MISTCLLFVATLDDEFARRILLPARLVAAGGSWPHIVFGLRVPRWVWPSPAAIGVVNRVHGRAPRTVGRIPSQRERPALPMVIKLCSGFETWAERWLAFPVHPAHFAGTKLEVGVASRRSRGPPHKHRQTERAMMPPCPALEFYRMNLLAHWMLRKLHAVARAGTVPPARQGRSRDPR